MKITAVKAYKRDLRLTKPYSIAWQRVESVENVFFEILLENGIRGIGAANPSPEVVAETPDETLLNLQAAPVTALVGKDIRSFLKLIDDIRQQFPGKPGTHACIDIALHDAFGQFLGIPIVDFYGRKHDRMPTSVTIGIMDINETIGEAAQYKSQGFRVLKLKTGLDASLDAARVLALRKQFGEHFTIRVDANAGYQLQDLNLFLTKTATAAIELIEQPLAPEIDAQLISLDPSIRQKLAADESLKDTSSALELSRDARYGIFNIKLMKCGGICGAMEIAAIAKPAGIALFWGCNDESRVSITAALHTAFSCANTKYIDLDGSFDLAEDIVAGGFQIKDGYMYPSAGPGLGLELL